MSGLLVKWVLFFGYNCNFIMIWNLVLCKSVLEMKLFWILIWIIFLMGVIVFVILCCVIIIFMKIGMWLFIFGRVYFVMVVFLKKAWVFLGNVLGLFCLLVMENIFFGVSVGVWAW